MRIGLFDSGIGGLTILKTLLKKYPNHEYIYLGDNKNLPYGNKIKEELLKLSKKNIDFLIKKNVDVIIIACGTVSANCYNELKETVDIRMFSIITNTNLYLEKSDFENILVLATAATVNSHVFKNYLKDKNVAEYACPNLASMIEKNILSDDVLNQELSTIDNQNYDCLVLGCTHYPIIEEKIKKIFEIPIIDMSEFIVVEDSNHCETKVDLFFTSLDEITRSNINKIIDFEYQLCNIEVEGE